MRLAAAAAAFLVLSGAKAVAGTIDTRPPNSQAGIGVSIYYGQTFLADDKHLQQFSFILTQINPGFTVVAQVFDTAGGIPTGPALYASAPFVVVGGPTEFTIMPDLFITPGTTYAVVARVTIDSGIIQQVNPGTYAGGTMIRTNNGGGTWAAVGGDLATLIVINPEPGTWALFGLGALGLGAAVRRRRRAKSS